MRKLVIIHDPNFHKKESHTQIIEVLSDNTEIELTPEEAVTPPKSIGENEARNILASLCSGETVSASDKNQLEDFIKMTIGQMASEKLDYDLQSLVDSYIYSYLEPRETSPGWNKTEASINQYYHDINEKNKKEQAAKEAQGIKNGTIKTKYLKANPHTKGLIMTVTVIEVTVLLGILIAAIALVNR